MISDSERREIAARLRVLDERIDGMPLMCTEQEHDAMVLSAIRAVVGNGDIFHLLADLIEPDPERTCKMIPFVEEDDSVFIVNCSECGDAIFARGGEHYCNFCPSCGAKVVGR